MTKLERIKKLIETEEQVRKREASEVTVDFPSVRAELRIECLEEVVKILAD